MPETKLRECQEGSTNNIRLLVFGLLALTFAAPALAQKMDGKMPDAKMSGLKMDAEMPEEKMVGMMGAPMFKYSANPMMNMMMAGNTVAFTKPLG
ncbi:hypothetical protein EHF33_16960 (plasmid) [Deinococcus psychrotolerans]|uniref:Uncharacterized protein n=1 Tax=Deinococcus psychrotolerans TaxID=2489213 RepID=A0A3G8YHY2_9DEIO|nr:hypothetical protein [Deinococcus psychrotolerans]AZI44593.1 hypothetical protein EHF33_16960 [Deinococcus psychrotolerans]